MHKVDLCRVQTASVNPRTTTLKLCNILQSLRLPEQLTNIELIKKRHSTATMIICAHTARCDGFVQLHLIFTENLMINSLHLPR